MAALKPCRTCGHKVAKSAPTCPSCGVERPIPRRTGWGWLLLLLLVLWVSTELRNHEGARRGSTSSGADRSENPNPHPGQDPATHDTHGAWAYTQLFVKRELPAPSTAKFRFGGFRDVTPVGGNRYSVVSYVDAENAVGAQERTRFKAIVERREGAWELISLRLED